MIILLEILENLNYKMLGLGAPLEKDDCGYNKPDYSICQTIRCGISYNQASILCNVFQKYTNTQLFNVSKEDLRESEDYYNQLSGKKPAINLVYAYNMSSIHFKYDTDIISIVKSMNNRKWDNLNKCWHVDNKEIIPLLDKLSNLCDTDNAKKYFQEKYKPIETVESEVKEPEKIKLITEQKNNSINLKLKYHAGFIAAVKSLTNRKYNSYDYSWNIDINEVNSLIQKLQKFEKEIDFSDLQKYTSKEEVKKEITLKTLTNNSITPFSHQVEAAKFLLENKKAILADEMGIGKTLSAILAANNIEGKKLIVCPASLKLNWQKEIKMLNSTAKIGIINGKTITDLNDCEWYIINYDILSKHVESLLAEGFKSVIMDECHYIKSINNSGKPTANRGKIALQIANNTEYCFLLTGTPITNKTKDIFNLLKAIDHPLTIKWFNFGMRYCNGYKDRYGYNFDGYSNTSELHEKISNKMMRRLKTELLDLPEKIRSFIPVEIDLKKYTSLFNDFMKQRVELTQGEQLVRLNALRHLLAIEKIPHTFNMIENLLEQEKQVIIFTCYQAVVDAITEKFQASKITGDCSAEQRQSVVEDFQKGKINVLVCNIQAAGVGLTLTSGDTIIFNDFDWTPANHLQAEDRIHRIGQKNNCNIYYMYAENACIDYKMSEIIEEKTKNINNIVDNNNSSMFELIKKSIDNLNQK